MQSQIKSTNVRAYIYNFPTKRSHSMKAVAFAAPTVEEPKPGPDLAAIKTRQQATWASGDFARVAATIVYPAEQLAESADLQAGWRVLDIATGSGNAAIAAARRGCEAVGVDYVPALLERGRLRAKTELVDVEFVEGDAEKLPFPDASFDAVLSIYGVMFAPNQHKAASEMARVCRPRGTIALASWTPEGFIGETFRLFSGYVPPAPGLTPPVQWGNESHLRTIFGSTIRSITSTVRTMIFRYPDAATNVEFFRRYYGPTLKLFQAVGEAKEAQLTRDLEALANKYDRNRNPCGPVAIAADYLETIITRA
jgi:ubiquinone/menaquinone biosynthesis C-methylase UbiE